MKSMEALLGKSYKTTAFGLLTVAAAVFDALKLLLDGDPTTNPDWNLIIPVIMSGLGSMFAKDYDIVGTERVVKTNGNINVPRL